MKASVQYNDLTGSVAADITDFTSNSLQHYLEVTYPTSYDNERYACKGCSMWISGQEETPRISISFICYDKEERKYIKFTSNKQKTLNEVFCLFKRLEIVMGENIDSINIEDEENLYLD